MRVARWYLGSITKNVVLNWPCLPWQYPMDMSGMGNLREQAVCQPPVQLREGQGICSNLCIEWLFSLARWLRRQSEGHKAASGLTRPQMEQQKPPARGSLKGQPTQSPTGALGAHCSSFSSGVSFIQANIVGWL